MAAVACSRQALPVSLNGTRRMLHVAVGQGGCQLAASLWWLAERDPFIAQDATSPPASRSGAAEPELWDGSFDKTERWAPADTEETTWGNAMFDRRCTARLVMVDSETKVVRGALGSGGTKTPRVSTLLPEWNTVLDRHGRANNWAAGYHHVEHRERAGSAAWDEDREETPLWERAMELIRRRSEGRDHVDSFCVIHSVGGGTGSGVSSRLLEGLAEAYPKATKLCTSLLPFESGGSPLQSYNTVLSLRYAHELCDAVLWMSNDDLMVAAEMMAGRAAATRGAGGAIDVSSSLCLSDANDWMALGLAGLLWPCQEGPSSTLEYPSARRLVDQLCPGPRMNFVTLYHASSPMKRGDTASVMTPIVKTVEAELTIGRSRSNASDLLRHPPPEHVLRAAALDPSLLAGASSSSVHFSPESRRVVGSNVSWRWLGTSLRRQMRATDRFSDGSRAKWVRAIANVRGISQSELLPPTARSKAAAGRGSATPVKMSLRPTPMAASSAGQGHHWQGIEHRGSADWKACASALEACVPATPSGAPSRFREELQAHCEMSGLPLSLAAGVRRSVTVACNSTAIVPRISLATELAASKARAGAYVHWLERYGVEASLVKECIEELRASMSVYSEL
jgi:hypothetical protein